MTVPAYITRDRGRSLAQDAISGLGGSMPPHVSIARNTFTLVDAAGNEREVETKHLDVIVVDINKSVSKVYYEGAFDPSAEDHKPPTCFSDNGVGASAQAISPQSVSCQLCPHNAWGSDTSRITGKATKACNDAKKVAVILPGDESELVYLLRVPPASLKIWKSYVQSVCSHPLQGTNRKMELFDFITRISFDKATQGVLNFAPCPEPWYSAEDADFLDQVFAEDKTSALVGKTDVVVTADRVQLNAAKPAAVESKVQAPPQPQTANNMANYLAQGPAQNALTVPPAAETPRRRGRPAKNPNTGAAPTPVSPAAPAQAQSPAPPGEPLDIPPFLQRSEPAPIPAPKAQFGMEQPEDAPEGLDAEIAKAFALST